MRQKTQHCRRWEKMTETERRGEHHKKRWSKQGRKLKIGIPGTRRLFSRATPGHAAMLDSLCQRTVDNQAAPRSVRYDNLHTDKPNVDELNTDISYQAAEKTCHLVTPKKGPSHVVDLHEASSSDDGSVYLLPEIDVNDVDPSCQESITVTDSIDQSGGTERPSHHSSIGMAQTDQAMSRTNTSENYPPGLDDMAHSPVQGGVSDMAEANMSLAETYLLGDIHVAEMEPLDQDETSNLLHQEDTTERGQGAMGEIASSHFEMADILHQEEANALQEHMAENHLYMSNGIHKLMTGPDLNSGPDINLLEEETYVKSAVISENRELPVASNFDDVLESNPGLDMTQEPDDEHSDPTFTEANVEELSQEHRQQLHTDSGIGFETDGQLFEEALSLQVSMPCSQEEMPQGARFSSSSNVSRRNEDHGQSFPAAIPADLLQREDNTVPGNMADRSVSMLFTEVSCQNSAPPPSSSQLSLDSQQVEPPDHEHIVLERQMLRNEHLERVPPPPSPAAHMDQDYVMISLENQVQYGLPDLLPADYHLNGQDDRDVHPPYLENCIDIKRAKELTSSIRKCATCFQCPRSHVNIPCRCLCNCQACSLCMYTCALCGATIETTVRVDLGEVEMRG